MRHGTILYITAALFGTLAALQARLEIHPSSFMDVGEFPAESAPVASFELVNTGSESLRIIDVKSDCYCFNPVIYTKTIPAHESTPLDVFIDADLLAGHFEKTVHVRIGGKNATNAMLKVTGTVQHAIRGAPRFVAAGHSAFDQPWSTNLLLTLRKDLSEIPVLRVDGHPGFEGKLLPTQKPGQLALHLSMPAQPHPIYWESRVVLSFEQTPAIRPTIIKINGYAGGTLHPSTQRLSIAKNKISITLQRTYPAGAPPRPTPLHCTRQGVSIKETQESPKQSTVDFSFSRDFLNQLEKEGQITIQLTAEGFIPVGLVVGK